MNSGVGPSFYSWNNWFESRKSGEIYDGEQLKEFIRQCIQYNERNDAGVKTQIMKSS